MACHLYGIKALHEPMLTCCQFDPYEQKFSEILIRSLIFFVGEIIFQNVFFQIVAICPELSVFMPLCVRSPQWPVGLIWYQAVLLMSSHTLHTLGISPLALFYLPPSWSKEGSGSRENPSLCPEFPLYRMLGQQKGMTSSVPHCCNWRENVAIAFACCSLLLG